MNAQERRRQFEANFDGQNPIVLIFAKGENISAAAEDRWGLIIRGVDKDGCVGVQPASPPDADILWLPVERLVHVGGGSFVEWPVDLVCDFCGEPNPTVMFAHGELRSELLGTVWRAGHCGACKTCADLMQRGEIKMLAERALDTGHRIPRDSPTWQIARLELYNFYVQISREPEPMEQPETYFQRKRTA